MSLASRISARLRAGGGRLYRQTGRRVMQRRLRDAVADGSRVHFGCGEVHLDGWVNVDGDRACHPDLWTDLRWGFPVETGALEYVFSEHVLEHLALEEATVLLSDCRRGLGADGVLRIAVPDLAAIIDAYRGDWRDQDWVRWPDWQHLDSAAHMLNVAVREWGHRYLYDEAELRLRLREAGFSRIERVAWGSSEHPPLRDLERRLDSKLIVEARP